MPTRLTLLCADSLARARMPEPPAHSFIATADHRNTIRPIRPLFRRLPGKSHFR